MRNHLVWKPNYVWYGLIKQNKLSSKGRLFLKMWNKVRFQISTRKKLFIYDIFNVSFIHSYIKQHKNDFDWYFEWFFSFSNYSIECCCKCYNKKNNLMIVVGRGKISGQKIFITNRTLINHICRLKKLLQITQ